MTCFPDRSHGRRRDRRRYRSGQDARPIEGVGSGRQVRFVGRHSTLGSPRGEASGLWLGDPDWRSEPGHRRLRRSARKRPGSHLASRERRRFCPLANWALSLGDIGRLRRWAGLHNSARTRRTSPRWNAVRLFNGRVFDQAFEEIAVCGEPFRFGEGLELSVLDHDQLVAGV